MSDAVFPTLPGLTWDISRNPRFHTIRHDPVDGKQARAAFMAYPLWDFELAYELIRDTAGGELQSLLGFYLSRQGGFDSWLYDCPEDNAVTAQNFGTGDGATLAFQLKRTWGGFDEPINNPKASPSIYIDGVLKTVTTDYTISSTGLVTFVTAPVASKAITWTGGFYYRCVFEEDKSNFVQFANNLYNLQSLTFIGSPVNKV
ncbi:MAG: DUF2460 domain-containing protein [Methylobacter sp.]|uniref:DUF2460 domain-containing protein n=1 Tax=Methylobacter sp. TaxID=2051955 RepID=UPI0025E0C0E2|nr:DUF2460 domain-containing protein [Methylobacter sp.]MCK9622197.1 DUF2460 domain-containing protein [Methylobacter sp.]